MIHTATDDSVQSRPGVNRIATDSVEHTSIPAVPCGEHGLLAAGSGRGKSTLLSLIAGIMDPQAGMIEVAGTNVHGLRGHKRDLFRGRHIGMIFQTFNLLTGFSALENVMAALM